MMFPSPIIAAPMAGGVSTPRLVTEVGRAGGLGFLAAGYKSVDQMREEIAAVRRAQVDFGVNVFVPAAESAPSAAVAAYRLALSAEAARYGIRLPEPRDDDDGWQDKLQLLRQDPVPFVSFTFGLPDAGTADDLRSFGTRVIATVTGERELESALECGVDAVVAQHPSAGGHSAVFAERGFGAGPGDPFAPENPVPDAAALTTRLAPRSTVPLIAAGGIADGAGIRRALDAGAAAVQLGTMFLRTPESGARQAHKDALVSGEFTRTAVTRAFSGRPARGLENDFMTAHRDAPAGYPAVHHLTAPLRAAAAAAGDPQGMALWAGTGFRTATAEPAGGIVRRLLAELGGS